MKSFHDRVFEELDNEHIRYDLISRLVSSDQDRYLDEVLPVSYEKMTVEQLFNALRNNGMDPRDYGLDWLEAENVFAFREAVSRWFTWLEDGSADKKFPDPTITHLTQERADKFIEDLEADFMVEKGRFKNLGKDAGPEFFRLKPHARMAMFQEIKALLKSEEQLQEELDQRRAAGEKIPPMDIPEYKQPYDNEEDYYFPEYG